LAWLGLVDIITDRNLLRAFRVRTSAGALVDRPIPEPAASTAAIDVSSDGSVRVPAGTTSADVHRVLADVGEFVGGSADGLRYRLSAERVQLAFDDGLTGPDLLNFLEDRASKPVPGRLRATIERWWARYNSVRLYDELSLVELSDEVLPEEILAAVPAVRQHLVYAISPRLLAVEPAAADTVVAELARLGYAPRVEHGGARV
ncbi:MAG TPA: helicase-associated domain-containing protein, partial [Chloroflexota bacterium]